MGTLSSKPLSDEQRKPYTRCRIPNYVQRDDRAAETRRWSRFAVTLVIALVLCYALAFILQGLPGVSQSIKDSRLLRHSSGELFLVAPLLPILSLGLLMELPRRGDASWLRYTLTLRLLSNISLVLAAAPYAFLFGAQYVPHGDAFSTSTPDKVLVLLCGGSALLVGAVPWVLAVLGAVRGRRGWWSLTMLLATGAFIWLNRGLLTPVRTGADIVNSMALGNDCLLFSIGLFTATLIYALWAGPREEGHGRQPQPTPVLTEAGRSQRSA
jgi:hypothetical protein